MWGTEGIAPSILYVRFRRRRVATLTPISFTLGSRAPRNLWIVGWLGIKAGLDAVETKVSACSAVFHPVAHSS